MIIDDPLIRRAAEAMAAAPQLRQTLRQTQEQVRHHAWEMARIGAELDPLLPLPPEELARVWAHRVQDPPEDV